MATGSKRMTSVPQEPSIGYPCNLWPKIGMGTLTPIGSGSIRSASGPQSVQA